MRLLLKLSVFNCTRMQIRQVFMNLGSCACLRLCQPGFLTIIQPEMPLGAPLFTHSLAGGNSGKRFNMMWRSGVIPLCRKSFLPHGLPQWSPGSLPSHGSGSPMFHPATSHGAVYNSQISCPTSSALFCPQTPAPNRSPSPHTPKRGGRAVSCPRLLWPFLQKNRARSLCKMFFPLLRH